MISLNLLNVLLLFKGYIKILISCEHPEFRFAVKPALNNVAFI